VQRSVRQPARVERSRFRSSPGQPEAGPPPSSWSCS
jgi:hypothetical protein